MAIVPKDMLDTLSDDEYYIPINFKAYSGNNATFEDKNMQYSNYKVLVTVGLLTSIAEIKTVSDQVNP